jgi:hypothetical protein
MYQNRQEQVHVPHLKQQNDTCTENTLCRYMLYRRKKKVHLYKMSNVSHSRAPWYMYQNRQVKVHVVPKTTENGTSRFRMYQNRTSS